MATPNTGLYDPTYQRDACGFGFVARVDGRRTRETVEEVLDDKGDVLYPDAPEEEEEDRGGEGEDTGEVDATDAARRKAGELGVNLSRVRGTGSNGRILVKDVERAARRSVA